MVFQNPEEKVIFDYLKKAKTIAIVGISSKPERTSFLVAKELQKAGYKIFPVNPLCEGEEILGEKVYGSLQEVGEHIDIVDIFRRSECLPEVARDFLTTDAEVFWAQQGLVSQEAYELLKENGKEKIVMDKCTKIELTRLKCMEDQKL